MRNDAYPFARERITELINRAHEAVGQIQAHQPDTGSTAFFRATWTTSRAAGFLEAFALVDPALASDMLPDFESVAGLVDRLRAAGDPGKVVLVTPRSLPTFERGSLADRRMTSRPEANIRRVAARRVTPERRVDVRRLLDDRRGR